MLAARRLVVFSIAAACSAQPDPWPEVLQLSRIKLLMKEHLLRIANFTCVETIERSKSDPSGRMKISDTLRLEVAFVDGKELYSWLGAGKFEESNIAAFTKGGAIGGGLFASHARSIFLERWPTFHYAGVETLQGRRAVRYNYEVPLLGSGFLLRIVDQSSVVGYSGSIWADVETLQISRLTVRADDVPIHLGVTDVLQSIDYGRVRLNNFDFLLPRSAEMILVYRTGGRSPIAPNSATGSSMWASRCSCSTMRPHPREKRTRPWTFPWGWYYPPASKPRFARTKRGWATGSRLLWTWKPARTESIVPAGATLLGRIRSIENPHESSGFFTLGLEFFELQMGSLRARFFGELSEVKSPGGVRKAPGGGLLGIALLQIRDLTLRDLRLIWKMGDL